MEIEIIILDYSKEVKGSKIAICDVELRYPNEKWRRFNRLSVFHKNDKFWISPPKFMNKEGKWVAYYEMDSESYNSIFPIILEKLKKEYI